MASLYERSMINLSKKQQLLAEALKSQEFALLENLQDRPTINLRSKQMIGSRSQNELPGALVDWKRKKDSKVHSYRLQEMFKKPSPQPRCRTPNGYSNPQEDWENHSKQYWKTRSQTPEEFSHRPKINKKRILGSKEKVEDRLLRLNYIREIKLTKQQVAQQQEAKTEKTPEKPLDYLHYIPINKTKTQEDNWSFTPKISPISHVLAAKAKYRASFKHTSENKEGSPSKLTQQQLDEFLNRNYFVRKKTCSLTPEPQRPNRFNKSCSSTRYESLFIDAKRREDIKTKSIDDHLELIRKKEAEECTFKPSISRKWFSRTPTFIDKRTEGYSSKSISYKDQEGVLVLLKQFALTNDSHLRTVERLELSLDHLNKISQDYI